MKTPPDRAAELSLQTADKTVKVPIGWEERRGEQHPSAVVPDLQLLDDSGNVFPKKWA
jgi:hypothetical protein